MNDLESVKHFIVELMEEKTGRFDENSLEADYKLDWESELSERLGNAFYNMSRAASAKADSNEVMLKAALLNSRTDFMDLANFFRDIYDDLDALVKHPAWPKIPKGFDYGKISE
ncbi:hypothetical protein [Pseudomonas sp. Sample_23]|uniref:hypothetical protein n=1 Tax=Pseudomonas sp. Sample_23 TaxID=2448267 RepID=UPI001032D4F1|nr:hypothetical protein [Pseudomonas sp. Sample_23]